MTHGKAPPPAAHAPSRIKTSVRSRGTVALPADLRERWHLDEPGAQIELTEDEDGRIELRPVLPVRADQRWFWTERWQDMEREVDRLVAAGEVTVVDGPGALFQHLDGTTTAAPE